MSNLHEECGIFGIFSENRQNVAETVYYGLFCSTGDRKAAASW